MEMGIFGPIDQLVEFVDELPRPVGIPVLTLAEATPPVHLLAEITEDATDPDYLEKRTYLVLTRSGPAAVHASGQLLEAEPELFRLSNWENGHKKCVGLFDRREVIGLFEVPKAAPANTEAV